MRSSYAGKATLSVLLISVSTFTGCTIPLKPPPAISYDDSAQPAGLEADPPKPVEVSSVIRASPSSFRVAWIQRTYENGSLSATERWTAILTIVIDPPRDPDRLRKNPLGVYVNAINWSKEMGQ